MLPVFLLMVGFNVACTSGANNREVLGPREIFKIQPVSDARTSELLLCLGSAREPEEGIENDMMSFGVLLPMSWSIDVDMLDWSVTSLEPGPPIIIRSAERTFNLTGATLNIGLVSPQALGTFIDYHIDHATAVCIG